MEFKRLPVGMLETNAFIVWDKSDCVIIDPADEYEKFVDFIEEKQLKVHAILITHGHSDHIGAVADLRKAFPDAEVICHAKERDKLLNPSQNLSTFLGLHIEAGDADRFIDDYDELEFGALQLTAIHVPGHTTGHLAFFHESNVVFCGDTLFAGGIGRSDLPGGNGKQLLENIHEKLLSLPDNTSVQPGHGPGTTIGIEKRENPFLDPNLELY